jgi:hypothetical protein
MSSYVYCENQYDFIFFQVPFWAFLNIILLIEKLTLYMNTFVENI